MLSATVFLLTVGLISVRAWLHINRRELPKCAVSVVAAWMYVFCLWIPAILQGADRMNSKLVGPGVLAPPDATETDTLLLKWSFELCVVLVAELFIVVVINPKPRITRFLGGFTGEEWRLGSFVLIVVGFLVLIIFPTSLADRAAAGQGIISITRGSLVCGLAILAYYKCFGKLYLFAVLLGGIGILVLGNVRSPISVIVIAGIAGLLARREIYKKRWAFGALVIALSAVVVGSFMSNMRASITRHQDLSTTEIIQTMLDDPLAAPYAAGIDTLDGYRFSEFAREREAAEPLDLLSPVYTFVPRSIWPGKPDSISVRLSTKYLRYKSSGQFLSVVGYLMLATGSYGLALVMLAIGAGILAYLSVWLAGSYWTVFVYVCLFRLFLNGTSFDVYYTITLLLPTLIALYIARVVLRGSTRDDLPASRVDGAILARHGFEGISR
ncbi:MAG: hypothetical protein QM673_01845 [Gordonia sp. (in: high G+C Gram-positive bacteria)]